MAHLDIDVPGYGFIYDEGQVKIAREGRRLQAYIRGWRNYLTGFHKNLENYVDSLELPDSGDVLLNELFPNAYPGMENYMLRKPMRRIPGFGFRLHNETGAWFISATNKLLRVVSDRFEKVEIIYSDGSLAWALPLPLYDGDQLNLFSYDTSLLKWFKTYPTLAYFIK